MIKTYLKILQLMLILAYYYGQVLLGNFLGFGSKFRTEKIRNKFAKAALKSLHIKVQVKGDIPAMSGIIYESNHKSMMDPIIFLSVASASPVAKAPIADYPLLGKAARDTGIIYVDRNNDASRSSTLVHMKEAIEAGDNILIYPEGTINTEPGLLPFKNGSFSLAAKEGFSICPVKLTYPDESYHWTSGSLIDHFTTAFIGKNTEVILEFYPLMVSNDYLYLRNRTYELLSAD